MFIISSMGNLKAAIGMGVPYREGKYKKWQYD